MFEVEGTSIIVTRLTAIDTHCWRQHPVTNMAHVHNPSIVVTGYAVELDSDSSKGIHDAYNRFRIFANNTRHSIRGSIGVEHEL